MTNAHVVKGCSALEVGLPGAPLRPANLIARDENNDLALLSSTITPISVPSLRPVVRTGESIAVYGFPLAGLLPSAGNFTVGNVTAIAGLRDDTSMLQISAPVQLGNSGGPVLDKAGNVVGVVVSKMNAIAAARVTSDIPQNVNFAIKSAVALTFLQSSGVEPLSATSSSLGPADLADRAKSFTVFVACRR
jgi:S1-C subfamily serine protease